MTKEEAQARENAIRYGVCLQCGTPREFHRGQETHPDGRTTMWSGIVAPCGHSQDVSIPTGGDEQTR